MEIIATMMLIFVLVIILSFIAFKSFKFLKKRIIKGNSFEKINFLTIIISAFVFFILLFKYDLFKSLIGTSLTLFFIRISYILYTDSK